MFQKIFLIIFLILILHSCSKKNDIDYEPKDKLNAYKLYQEGFDAFQKGDYFFANKKFFVPI